MRFLAGIIALIIIAGLAGTLVGRSTAPISDLRAAEQAEADAGLDRIVPELDLDDTPLDQAIESLRHQTDTNIAVNWHALEAVGIDRKQPVTLRLRKLPLRQLLDILCRVVSGGGVPLELATQAENGVIHVSTGEDLDRDTVVRLYEVKDILKWDDTAPPPTTRPAALFSGYATVSTGALPSSYDEAMENLTLIITETIAPESWRDAGGTIGTIRDFNGNLLIVQTKRNHILIEGLLAQLRAEPVKLMMKAPTF